MIALGQKDVETLNELRKMCKNFDHAVHDDAERSDATRRFSASEKRTVSLTCRSGSPSG